MGGSRGQRWFRLPWYQNRGDRSSADVCAEYKNSLDLMTVARFQKCVPLCVYELWKLSDWGRGALSSTTPHHPSQFVSRVRAFTDQAVWSGSVGSVVCSCASLQSPWAALAYWPRQLCRLHQSMPQNFYSVHLRVWKKKKKSFSSGNKNMSTLIHVKKNDCILVSDECVCETASVCFCVFVCVLALKLSIFYHRLYITKAKHCTVWLELKLTSDFFYTPHTSASKSTHFISHEQWSSREKYINCTVFR